MTLRFMFIALLGLLILLKLSCVLAPVEVKLDEKIEITRKQVNQISDEILAEITDLDSSVFGLATKGEVDLENCKDAFNDWIKVQFNKGLVPKKVVAIDEYGASNVFPHKDQCQSVDLGKEFIRAQADRNKKATKKEALIFRLHELKEILAENGPCATHYMAKGERKITLDGIYMDILVNKLNYYAPIYDVYYTTKTVTKNDLEQEGAEQNLISNGALKYFAESESLKPGFTGPSRFKLIKDLSSLNEAQEKIGTLEADIIAIPKTAKLDLAIKKQDGQEFFIIPQGMLEGTLNLEVSLKAEVGDAICALKEFKRESKKIHE